jgi:hypothetical protein
MRSGSRRTRWRLNMSVGRLILRRFNGTEEFEIQRASISAVRDEDGYRLWFKAETEGVCRKSLPDTIVLRGQPTAEAAVTVNSVEPQRLGGRRFAVPTGYDEAIGDHVATFYYVEHEDLDENAIEILSQDGAVFHVYWIGTTVDVNYYDGSKPRTQIEIDAKFTFRDFAKWTVS